jgi:hypothetical protein
MVIWQCGLLVVWWFNIAAILYLAGCRVAVMTAWLFAGRQRELDNPTRRTFSG